MTIRRVEYAPCLHRVLMVSVLVSAMAIYQTAPAWAEKSEKPVGVKTIPTVFSSSPDENTTCSYRWPPRVIYNTDGNWVFNYLPHRRPENLTGIMDALKDTSVDVISVLVGIDDDLSWRGSPYGELFGDATSIWAADGDPTHLVDSVSGGRNQISYQSFARPGMRPKRNPSATMVEFSKESLHANATAMA